MAEPVLPGVWRWADAAGSDRCGTALATADGLVLLDPPAIDRAALRAIQQQAGPPRHVVLTSARHLALAAPFRGESVVVWAPPPGAGTAQEAGAGVDRLVRPGDTLPGGLIVLQLPAAAAPDGEVAYLWPEAGRGLLITGDVLPVVGQTPVYREGAAPPPDAFLDAIRALLAAEPGTLAPAHQGAPERQVAFSTAYAAHIGTPFHARRAAPVQGPRLLVPEAERVLLEAWSAPVILRRPADSAGATGAAGGGGAAGVTDPAGTDGRWIADPFACARCGKPNQPMPQTCGGPMIPRLCNACRAERRQKAPRARIMICAGGCCTREGARVVLSAARQALDARGLGSDVDVVPVSCLGECSLGPFVHVASPRGEELPPAARFRARTVERARRFAAEEGEVIDEESERVLSRFAALVRPGEMAALVDSIARDLASD